MNKTIRGYSAQARFYAAHLEQENGEWCQLGWTRVNERTTKPVFRASDGMAVYITDDALDHLKVHIVECSTRIVATEDELFATKHGE